MEYKKSRMIPYVSTGMIYNFFGNMDAEFSRNVINAVEDVEQHKKLLSIFLTTAMFYSEDSFIRKLIELRFQKKYSMTKISYIMNISEFQIYLDFKKFLHNLFLYQGYRIDTESNDVFKIAKLVNLIEALDCNLDFIEQSKLSGRSFYYRYTESLRARKRCLKEILAYVRDHIRRSNENLYYQVISEKLCYPDISNGEIADKYKCSPATVSIYIGNYRKKINELI